MKRPYPPGMSRMRFLGFRVTMIVGAGALGLTACALHRGDSESSGGSLIVMVASSASRGVSAAARAFESEHPGMSVLISSGSSGALVRQLESGTTADVLITADIATMARAQGKQAVSTIPVTVARGRLVLAVPKGNPGRVTSLADLSKPDLVVALCVVEAPCGAAAQKALSARGINASVDTYESDSGHARGRLALGEADAALIWAADLGSDGKVQEVRLSAGLLPSTSYPAAVVSTSTNTASANQFVLFLLGARGQEELTSHGLGPK